MIDRKLDIEVAEKFFGLQVEEREVWVEDIGLGEYPVKRWQVLSEVFEDGSGWWEEDLPYYSTKIEDAFKIMKNLENSGRVVLLMSEMPLRFSCDIVFHLGMGSFEEYKTEADTMEKAICLAALEMSK